MPEDIEIYVMPGNASRETIQGVLEALSDLHIASGGLGLEFSVPSRLVGDVQEPRYADKKHGS